MGDPRFGTVAFYVCLPLQSGRRKRACLRSAVDPKPTKSERREPRRAKQQVQPHAGEREDQRVTKQNQKIGRDDQWRDDKRRRRDDRQPGATKRSRTTRSWVFARDVQCLAIRAVDQEPDAAAIFRRLSRAGPALPLRPSTRPPVRRGRLSHRGRWHKAGRRPSTHSPGSTRR